MALGFAGALKFQEGVGALVLSGISAMQLEAACRWAEAVGTGADSPHGWPAAVGALIGIVFAIRRFTAVRADQPLGIVITGAARRHINKVHKVRIKCFCESHIGRSGGAPVAQIRIIC